MKPTSHRTVKSRLDGDNAIASRGFPVVHSDFQSLKLEGYRGGCADTRTPSFRSISNGYFQNEARQSFVTEAIFFGLMVMTSAWPVFQAAKALAHLVRAFAGV